MPPDYTTPGVYIEEAPRFPLPITPVDTALPAFIGYTQKADDTAAGDLHLKPVRISSMLEYERYFGVAQPEEAIKVSVAVTVVNGVASKPTATATLAEDARSKHLMHYALQLFFAAGGGACYVVSVNPYKPRLGDALVKAEMQAGLDALAKVDGPTLIVFPEALALPIADFKALQDAALYQCAELRDRFVIMDVHGDGIALSAPAADVLAAVANFRTRGIGARNLQYGAAYAPHLQTGLDFAFDEGRTDVTVVTNGAAAAAVKLSTLKARKRPLYALAKAAIRDVPCSMPPASAMAGVYAAVDASRGVWKAPANVGINAVARPMLPISSQQQDGLNVDASTGKSVNPIRHFEGKGTLVWGARTLAGNDNEWRYVSVRRLFIFVEQSIRKGTVSCVFEPNDANTWTKIQAMIENFLLTLWRQGALQGAKADHAFAVSVGLGRTMTAQDVLENRMVVEVGMAAVRPAEFSVLRLIYNMAEPA